MISTQNQYAHPYAAFSKNIFFPTAVSTQDFLEQKDSIFGYIGELSRILTEAAATAVQNETEQINHEVLDSIGWVTPTERKRQIDKLA